MQKRRLTALWGISFFLSLLMTGCSIFDCRTEKDSKSGLQIYSITTSIGAIDNNNFDIQRFSYSIYLTNEDSEKQYVKWIEPVLGDSFAKRVTNQDLKVNINKPIEANENIEIEGELIFDSGDLSKQDIVDLEPYITDIKIVSEKIINVETNN